MNNQFPRAPDDKPSVLSGKIWNRAADVLEASQRLAVASPLALQKSPAGDVLSITLPPGTAMLRLTGPATGAGTYTARVQKITTNTQVATTDLNFATWYADLNSSDDAIFENAAENLGGSGSHLILPIINTFVLARLSSRYENTTPSAPIPIYEGYVAISGSLDVGTYCDGNTPPYVNNPGIQKLYFEFDDFVYTSDVDPTIARIAWAGIDFGLAADYTGTIGSTVCAAKFIELGFFPGDTGTAPLAPTLVIPDNTTLDQYPIRWGLTSADVADDCDTCVDPTTKNAAVMSASIYIDPCKYLPSVGGAGLSGGGIDNFNFVQGTKVTALSSDGGCKQTAIIGLDLIATESDFVTPSPYVGIDASISPAKIKLCTTTVNICSVVVGGNTLLCDCATPGSNPWGAINGLANC